jgi:hypothetical protein
MTLQQFEVGDKVILKSNPFEDGDFLTSGEKLVIDVKDTSDITGTTSSQWIKVEGYNDWIDSTWLKKEND